MKGSKVILRPLIDNNFGKEYPLSFHDKMFIRRRRLLPSLFFDHNFHNIIIPSPYCHTPFGKREFFVVNTDHFNDYRVTLRLNWRQGSDEGISYTTLVVRAGAKVSLGCENSSTLPMLHRSWEVVGEVAISCCGC